MSINWNEYIYVFPERYIEHGVFDHTLEKYVFQQAPSNVLDVGGGVYGTGPLMDFNVPTTLLDPYVNPVDNRFKNHISWADLNNVRHKFDLIVCRGSINYLSHSQIRLLYECSENIIANTFRPFPGVKYRSYKSQIGNGLEISLTHEDKVNHILIDQDMNTIYHSFNAYSVDTYKHLMPLIDIYAYNKSLLLVGGDVCIFSSKLNYIKRAY